MEVYYERCCGIDVHKKVIVCCLRIGSKKETKDFGTSTEELRQMAQWLQESGCQITAMERTKENEWLVDLLQSVLENYTRLSYLSLEEWKMNPDSEGNVTGPDRLLPSLYSDGAEISRIVHAIVPGADLLYRQGYLQIFLDLTADEQYARKSVELTDRLYRALMPKGFFAEEIWIIFKEENNSVFERARIIFDRRYGTVQSSGEAGKPGGKYYCNLIVGGGETEKYAGEIEESFKQLDWYQEIEKIFSD